MIDLKYYPFLQGLFSKALWGGTGKVPTNPENLNQIPQIVGDIIQGKSIFLSGNYTESIRNWQLVPI